MLTNNFALRHNGVSEKEIPEMLEMAGVESLEQLIDETIPRKIRLKQPLNLPKGLKDRKSVV